MMPPEKKSMDLPMDDGSKKLKNPWIQEDCTHLMKNPSASIGQISALQLNGYFCDYLVDLGHFLGQESHDFPGLII